MAYTGTIKLSFGIIRYCLIIKRFISSIQNFLFCVVFMLAISIFFCNFVRMERNLIIAENRGLRIASAYLEVVFHFLLLLYYYFVLTLIFSVNVTQFSYSWKRRSVIIKLLNSGRDKFYIHSIFPNIAEIIQIFKYLFYLFYFVLSELQRN